MSTALDKSLDEIIASSRKARKVGGKKNKPVGKGVGKAQKKKTATPFKKTTKPAAAKPTSVISGMDLTYATKVVAHGLPKDLRQENIKEFFQSQIGGVQSVMMNYNEKGIFKGIATIMFKSSNNAVKAVEKYNNAPIDGGASKLKLELVIDPSKKPLSARIVANAAAQTDKKKDSQDKKKELQEKKKLLQQKKKEQAKAKAVNSAKAGRREKAAKKAKTGPKTAEQLDQEMADYFNN